MGLAWQQGPLSEHFLGHLITPQPMPARIPYAEPLRRRMKVNLPDKWIADSQDVVVLHERPIGVPTTTAARSPAL
jgi:hypothetical protein